MARTMPNLPIREATGGYGRLREAEGGYGKATGDAAQREKRLRATRLLVLLLLNARGEELIVCGGMQGSGRAEIMPAAMGSGFGCGRRAEESRENKGRDVNSSLPSPGPSGLTLHF
jgi:hypothetical protein